VGGSEVGGKNSLAARLAGIMGKYRVGKIERSRIDASMDGQWFYWAERILIIVSVSLPRRISRRFPTAKGVGSRSSPASRSFPLACLFVSPLLRVVLLIYLLAAYCGFVFRAKSGANFSIRDLAIGILELMDVRDAAFATRAAGWKIDLFFCSSRCCY